MSRRPLFLRALGLLLATRLAFAPLAAQPVLVDPSFAPQLLNDVSAISSLVLTPLDDGQLLVRGDFTHVNGAPADGFARLRPDGTRDPAFATTFPRRIWLAAPLPGGRIIALRSARDGSTPFQLERLLADGTPDSTYTPIDTINQPIARLVPQPDGRVLVAGSFTTLGSLTRFGLARLRADGTLDPTFDAGPRLDTSQLIGGGLAAQPDGKVLYCASYFIFSEMPGTGGPEYYLARLNADGTADNGFGVDTSNSNLTVVGPWFGAPLHSIAVLPDGRILAATGSLLVRFSANGIKDPTFAPAIPGLRRVDQVVALADGRILVQARVSPVVSATNSPLTPSSVFLLDANGAVLRDFRTSLPPDASLELLAAPPAGSFVVRYGFPILSGTNGIVVPLNFSILLVPAPAISLAQPAFARFDLSGTRDATFAPIFTQRSPVRVNRLATDDAGRLLAAGAFTSIDGRTRPGLARFLADGSLDPAFQPAPHAAQSTQLTLLQPDGKVILGETILGAKNADGLFSVVAATERLLVDGTPDAGFSTSGTATIQAIDSNGYLFASGFEPDSSREDNLKIFRLNPDGSRAATLSTTFSGFEGVVSIPEYHPTGLLNQVRDLRPLPDGKLLVHTTSAAINGATVPGFVRLNPDGSTDATYHPAVPPADPIYSPTVEFLADGRVFYTEHHAYGLPAATTIRLLPDGSRDPAFIPLPGTKISGILQLSTGSFLSRDGTRRWLANGLPDLNYSVTFGSSTSSSDAAESAGLIYLGGNFVSVNGQPRAGLARLVPDETPGFTHQPQSQTVVAGRTAVFQAALGTSAPATYQWTFNGAAVAGATGPALILGNTAATQAGDYRLIAATGGQTYTSNIATLTVAPNTSRLVNFSARSRVSPGNPPQIGGFVLRGSAPRPVLLRAIGLGLSRMISSSQLLPQPVLRLHDGSALIAENTGGALASDIEAVAQRVGAFPPNAFPFFPSTNYGSALSVSLPAKAYTAQTFSGDVRSGISLFEFYDAADSTAPSAVANVSIRGHTAPGNDVLIAGFVIAGNGPLTVLIRGIGPALTPFGVSGALADPQLTLCLGSNILATDDNWSDQSDAALIAAAAQSTGAFALPAGSLDAALLVTLEPGAYTVLGSGTAGASGEMMIEFYVVH